MIFINLLFHWIYCEHFLRNIVLSSMYHIVWHSIIEMKNNFCNPSSIFSHVKFLSKILGSLTYHDVLLDGWAHPMLSSLTVPSTSTSY